VTSSEVYSGVANEKRASRKTVAPPTVSVLQSGTVLHARVGQKYGLLLQGFGTERRGIYYPVERTAAVIAT
jgi:hypothetical protein